MGTSEENCLNPYFPYWTTKKISFMPAPVASHKRRVRGVNPPIIVKKMRKMK